MRQQAGYTLLELLVVLAIMALLIATIPGTAMQGVNTVRFSGKVQEVAYRLRAAHERAIENGRTIVVRAADLEESGVVVALPPSVPAISFFPDGSVAGDFVTVSYLGRRKCLWVDPITGQVSISLNRAGFTGGSSS